MLRRGPHQLEHDDRRRAAGLVVLTTAALAISVSASSGASDPFTPLAGSKVISAPGGLKLTEPPKTIACEDLQRSRAVIGAKFLKKAKAGGASTVETLLVKGPGHNGALPNYLVPSATPRWQYGGIRVKCGSSFRIRYVILLGDKTPRPRERVEYSFKVTAAA